MKIEQVTNQKHQTTETPDELHRSKEAVLLPKHDQPSAHIPDAKADQIPQQHLKLRAGLANGERDILAGNTRSHADAKKKLSKWLT